MMTLASGTFTGSYGNVIPADDASPGVQPQVSSSYSRPVECVPPMPANAGSFPALGLQRTRQDTRIRGGDILPNSKRGSLREWLELGTRYRQEHEGASQNSRPYYKRIAVE